MKILLIAIPLSALLAAADNPACRPLMDAERKLRTTPVHIYSAQTAIFTGGKPRTSESIYVNNKCYVNIQGTWKSSPVPWATDKEKKDANLGAKNSCNMVGDDSVNGEPAIRYNTHTEIPDAGTVDSQIWVSKARGLTLKAEVDTNVGGTAGKSHSSVRYDYTNVQAPAGLP